MLRRISLGELLLIDITWGWEVSGGPVSVTQPSHLKGSGPTPGQSTKTLPATRLRRKGREKKQTNKQKRTDRTLGQMVKANLYRQNLTKKHTHTHSQKEKKEEKIYIYIKEESNQTNKQLHQ